jgi:hypothetical protein
MSEALVYLGLVPNGANYRTFRKYLMLNEKITVAKHVIQR